MKIWPQYLRVPKIGWYGRFFGRWATLKGYISLTLWPKNSNLCPNFVSNIPLSTPKVVFMSSKPFRSYWPFCGEVKWAKNESKIRKKQKKIWSLELSLNGYCFKNMLAQKAKRCTGVLVALAPVFFEKNWKNAKKRSFLGHFWPFFGHSLAGYCL